MPKILKRKEIGIEIENLIKESKQYLIIVSPFIKLTKELESILLDKYDKILINIVFAREDINQKTFDFFNQFPNIFLYSNKFLHAKSYINEQRAIISSMNLYKYSIENNFEIGVVFKNKGLDKKHYEEIRSEVDYIIERSFGITEKQIELVENEGKFAYCTSCKKSINFKSINLHSETLRPFLEECVCKDCNTKFTKLEKEEKITEIWDLYGTYCFLCGKKVEMKMPFLPIPPMCDNCMEKNMPANESIPKINL